MKVSGDEEGNAIAMMTWANDWIIEVRIDMASECARIF